MKIGYRKFIATVVGVLALSVVGHAQYKSIADHYTRNPFPAVQIKTDARDADVVEQLNLRAILAVLKHELAVKNNFSDLSFKERGQLIAILNDPKMVLDYTGLQGRTALTRGGQAINKDLVRLDQAAFYNADGPRSAHDIAKIILHELGHIWQLRYGTVTQYLWKESRPEYLEANLPSANFSSAILSQVRDLMGGKKTDDDSTKYDPAVVAWEGTWEVTSHWTKPTDKTSVTWRFTVEALEGDKCRIKAGRNQFDGKISGTTLTWKDPGLGIHKYVNYTFWRNGDSLKGKFDGQDRAGNDIEGNYDGHRVD